MMVEALSHALSHTLGPLAPALAKKGFTELTSVQIAVLAPSLQDRDLRITSQTGSGKTVAIGFVLRTVVGADCTAGPHGVARPRAFVVAPTRELARQVEEELSWLYAPIGALVTSTTGGASARDERRALTRGPAVIVATPGRLLDHLTRGSIDASQVAAVVLDEADRMLDLGFRDDLKAILGFAPQGRRTHLVSATFPRDVRALADSVQQDAVHVEGTRLGEANVDIDHLVHVVDPKDRMNAIVNLLLAQPDAQTLVFGRTRADVAKIAGELARANFAVDSLSGEMDQAARNRALAAFRGGRVRILVATDVAARGIDVQDIAYVIHAEPPTDADSYTHRSGRTGRAGRKGKSSLLVTPSELRKARFLLGRAKVTHTMAAVPSAHEIRGAADERLFAELTGEPGAEEPSPPTDAATQALAARLAAHPSAVRIFERVLLRLRAATPAEPRPIAPVTSATAPDERPVRSPRPHGQASNFRHAHPTTMGQERNGPLGDQRRGHPASEAPERWVTFQVSWGHEHGADARRLMAIVCRRGGIRGADVGAIRVGPRSSMVEVSAGVAQAFASAALAPDPRDPRVRIRRVDGAAAPSPPRVHDDRPKARAPKTDHARPSKPASRARPRSPR